MWMCPKVRYPEVKCERAAGMVTDAFSDYVVGHGELWCAQLFAATVRRLGAGCGFMDTREVRPTVRPPAGGVPCHDNCTS